MAHAPASAEVKDVNIFYEIQESFGGLAHRHGRQRRGRPQKL
jgi:hypothetical protein